MKTIAWKIIEYKIKISILICERSEPSGARFFIDSSIKNEKVDFYIEFIIS